jgi:protein TonB
MTMTNKALVVAFALLANFAGAQDQPTVEYIPGDEGERVPLHTVVPLYPEKARRARIEGEVEVCFNVDREGNTSRVAVRHSTNRVFEKPARDAIRSSTYQPLPPEQQLSGIKTCRTFRFTLTKIEPQEPRL